MTGLTPHALAVLSAHHGVATTTMLRQAGVGRAAIVGLVERGVLVREHERVVRIASSPATLLSRCAGMCLAYPAAFVTGPTAGKLTGLRRMPRPDPIHLCVRHGSNVGPLVGVVLRQSTSIHPSDVQSRRPDGIRLASPPRLVFDLGADLTQADHASVVEQVLHEERCTFATMLITARRLLHPLRPGSTTVATTLESRVAGNAAESHDEVDLARALRSTGVPVEVGSTWLDLPNGGRAHLDLSVPALRWGIEVDVHPDHLLLEGTSRDKRRDRQCHLIGWQVERVTRLDLADLPGLCVELRALYLARVAERATAAA